MPNALLSSSFMQLATIGPQSCFWMMLFSFSHTLFMIFLYNSCLSIHFLLNCALFSHFHVVYFLLCDIFLQDSYPFSSCVCLLSACVMLFLISLRGWCLFLLYVRTPHFLMFDLRSSSQIVCIVFMLMSVFFLSWCSFSCLLCLFSSLPSPSSSTPVTH